MINFIFYIFAAVLLISAFFVITFKNPVHSVLFLILAFFNAAGLLILIGAEYVAMTLVIVYVGAIAVLFLFVVMMLDINYSVMKKDFFKLFPLVLLLGCLLFFLIYYSINESEKYLVMNKAAIVQQKFFQGNNNVKLIGNRIYTDYMLEFQLSGIILLVAMIGAIVLTFRKKDQFVRRQRISEQVHRKREDSVKVLNVTSRKGVDV